MLRIFLISLSLLFKFKSIKSLISILLLITIPLIFKIDLEISSFKNFNNTLSLGKLSIILSRVEIAFLAILVYITSDNNKSLLSVTSDNKVFVKPIVANPEPIIF